MVKNRHSTWLFDVDGTLTPAGGAMDPRFERWFAAFCEANDVRIVSGGSYARVRTQLGPRIIERITAAYCCLGNVWLREGVSVFENEFIPSDSLTRELSRLCAASEFSPNAEGTQLIAKPGLLSLVVPGVDASHSKLHEYAIWDGLTKERQAIANLVKARFPEISALVSGRSSIDIGPLTNTKAQVIRDLERPTIFFGDAMLPGGVDFELGQKLNQRNDGSRAVPVVDWQQTFRVLHQLQGVVLRPADENKTLSFPLCI